MRKISLLILLIMFCSSFKAIAQSKTGQICFIRSTGYVGSMVNDKVYIDDQQVCKLKNNQYSLHTVPVGDHTVAAKSTGLTVDKRSAPFTVKVEEDKITYVDVVLANSVSVEEITKSSADSKMKSLKETKNCVTTE